MVGTIILLRFVQQIQQELETQKNKTRQLERRISQQEQDYEEKVTSVCVCVCVRGLQDECCIRFNVNVAFSSS